MSHAPFADASDVSEIRDLFSAWADGEIAGHGSQWDHADALPLGVGAALAELGALGIVVSEEAGGVAMGAAALSAAVEELSARCGALGLWVANQATLARLFEGAAGPGVHWLADLLSGEVRWAGTHLGRPLMGSLVDDGVSLRGQTDGACWPGAQRACVLVDYAGRTWLSQLALDAPGVSFDLMERPLGMRGAGLGTLKVGEAIVSEDSLIPLPPKLLEEARGLMTLGLASVSAGIGRAAVAKAAAYAGERKQFGRAIGTFQGVGFKLAESATEVDAARLVLRAAAGDHGQPGFRAAADAARVLAVSAALGATDDAIQIHGGYGYTREYEVERFWRDAKAAEVLGGGVALSVDHVAERWLTELGHHHNPAQTAAV